MAHNWSSETARIQAHVTAYTRQIENAKRLIESAPDADAKAAAEYVKGEAEASLGRWIARGKGEVKLPKAALSAVVVTAGRKLLVKAKTSPKRFADGSSSFAEFTRNRAIAEVREKLAKMAASPEYAAKHPLTDRQQAVVAQYPDSFEAAPAASNAVSNEQAEREADAVMASLNANAMEHFEHAAQAQRAAKRHG